MNDLLNRLPAAAKRGSKPRCHVMTHGATSEVAARLTELISPWATLSPTDRWMPQGFERLEEAQLNHAPRLLEPEICQQLARWWLPAGREDAMTPNFDIASTCTICGLDGLLLVEAKAHAKELENERTGRRLRKDASDGRRASHRTIGEAIEGARQGLSVATSLPWRISRDSHYQMSNRFAWAWKLAALGKPVILVYLGFLRAYEMKDLGEPFADHGNWEALVKAHSAHLFPSAVWNQCWSVNGVPIIPLIRSLELPFDREVDLQGSSEASRIE